MQCFFERVDGVRVPIGKEAMDLALMEGSVFRTISTPSVTVVRASNHAAIMQKAKPEPNYRYGRGKRAFSGGYKGN